MSGINSLVTNWHWPNYLHCFAGIFKFKNLKIKKISDIKIKKKDVEKQKNIVNKKYKYKKIRNLKKIIIKKFCNLNIFKI